MQRHHPQTLSEDIIISDSHPTFAGRDRLVRIESKAGDVSGIRSTVLPWSLVVSSPRCRECMGCVFDHPEIVLCGEVLDSLDLHHEATDVYWNYPDYRQVSLPSCVVQVHVQRIWIAIH